MALYESDLAQTVAQHADAEAYRLLFLPNSSDQTSMRIIAWSDGTGRLIFHRLDRSHCDDSKGDVEEDVFAISRSDVALLRAAVADYGFWTAPYIATEPGEQTIGCSHGLVAYFEGMSGGKYHVIDRRCAWSRKFQNIVALVHKFARKKEPDSATILD